MTAREQEFDRKLNELCLRKPPGISASKIKDLTRIAMTNPKHYKNIVYSVQKFIQKCGSDYKLAALYVLDSISQAAQKQKTVIADKESDGSAWSGAEYLERFEKILEEMFSHIMMCPEHDKEKVKRVLDIWLTKDVIYDKEIIRKIIDTYFPQRTVTNPLENSVHESQPTLFPTTLGGDPRMVSAPINPATAMDQNSLSLTSAKLDSSTLLATLKDLTQGTLNIPAFLSSNPITVATSQPINTNITFNNVATNSQQLAVSAAPPFANMNMPASVPLNTVTQPSVPAPMNTSNGFLQPQLSSSTYATKAVTSNTNTTKANAPVNDPLDFDYGDMDEDEDVVMQLRSNGEINSAKEANLTSTINMQPINV